MKKGGQPGNNNAGDGKVWRAAIRRALDRRTPKKSKTEAIDELAEKFLEACDDKEGWAFKELGDRLDGKPNQSLSGEGGGPIKIEEIRRTVVDPK